MNTKKEYDEKISQKDFFKINEQCLQGIFEISNILATIETKGDGTIAIYKARVMLYSLIEQLKEDNKSEDGLVVDNTQESKKDNSGG